MASEIKADLIKDKSGTKTLATLSSSAVTLHSDVTFPAGTIVQVKSKQDSTQDSWTQSTTPLPVGGGTGSDSLLKVSITPTSASNTIFIHGCAWISKVGMEGGFGIGRHLASTTFSDSAVRIGATGASSDSTNIKIGLFYTANDDFRSNIYGMSPVPFSYMDNGYDTTSELTYTVYTESDSANNFYYNRPDNTTNDGRATSFIHAFEIVGTVTT